VEGRQETKKNKIKKNLLEGDRFFASKKGKKTWFKVFFSNLITVINKSLTVMLQVLTKHQGW